MSLSFNNFHEAWRKKFPNCALPNTWERDIHAVLEFHKERFEFLRAELESMKFELMKLKIELDKEQYYIEFFEKFASNIQKNIVSIECSKNKNAVLKKSSSHGDIYNMKETIFEIWNNSLPITSKTTVNNLHLVPETIQTSQPHVTVINLQCNDDDKKMNLHNLECSFHDSLQSDLNIKKETNALICKNIAKISAYKSENCPKNSVFILDSKLKTNSSFRKIPPKPLPKSFKPKLNCDITSQTEFHQSRNPIKELDNQKINENKMCVKETKSSQCLYKKKNDENIKLNEATDSDEYDGEFNSSISDVLENESASYKFDSLHVYDSVPFENSDVEGDYVYLTTNSSNINKYDMSNLSEVIDGTSLVNEPSVTHHKTFSDEFKRIENSEIIDNLQNINKSSIRHDFNLQTLEENSLESFNDTSDKFLPISQEDRFHKDYTADDSSLTKKIDNSVKCNYQNIYFNILQKILKNENEYLHCLNVLMKATLDLTQPVLSRDDFICLFFKIPELYSIHSQFSIKLQEQSKINFEDMKIGDIFKEMARNLKIYQMFHNNFSKSITCLHRCKASNDQFQKIDGSIPVFLDREVHLELLLRQPLLHIQKLVHVIPDLLKYMPESHKDFADLNEANTIVKEFVKEFSLDKSCCSTTQQTSNQALIKHSNIIELTDGRRRLRHLFLFSDVLISACAEHPTFEIKWFIPLSSVIIPVEKGDCFGITSYNNSNLLQLKSQISNLRDHILNLEKSGRNVEKQRRKLVDLEESLIIMSPTLVFRLFHNQLKLYTFFLSSEFERTVWIEAIQSLQNSMTTPVTPNLSSAEVQNLVNNCVASLQHSIVAKNDILTGYLKVTIHKMQGLSDYADIFIGLEIDSHGHFFLKAETGICHSAGECIWNEEFVIELEQSQILRILCYEKNSEQNNTLKGWATLQLSLTWLQEHDSQQQTVSLQGLSLILSLHYESRENTLHRAPFGKTGGIFGINIQNTCRREKRPVPFLMTCCIREVDRRGLTEVGIYRVSGSVADILKLKKSFETNIYEAEQLSKEVDIHSVAGLLRLYLRELPEGLCTDALYPQLLEIYGIQNNEKREEHILFLFTKLNEINLACFIYLLDHLLRVYQMEKINKMSLYNLATVFGPTILRPANKISKKDDDQLADTAVDVMAQAGVLYCLLELHLHKQFFKAIDPLLKNKS